MWKEGITLSFLKKAFSFSRALYLSGTLTLKATNINCNLITTMQSGLFTFSANRTKVIFLENLEMIFSPFKNCTKIAAKNFLEKCEQV